MDCPWNSPGQNTGVGSLSLLQAIFPTKGSNLGCGQIHHQVSYRVILQNHRIACNLPKEFSLFYVSLLLLHVTFFWNSLPPFLFSVQSDLYFGTQGFVLKRLS